MSKPTPFFANGAGPKPQKAPLLSRPNREAAPRISMADADKYHSNCDLTILAEPTGALDDIPNAYTFECLVSKVKFVVCNFPEDFNLTMCVELTIRLHPGGTSSDLYHYDLINACSMDDDFDVVRYKKLLEVIERNKGLFYEETI